MNLTKTAILNIALEIERHGIELYEQIREKNGDRELLDWLIDQEKAHIKIFHNLFDAGGAVHEDLFNSTHLNDDMLAAAYGNTELFAKISSDSALKDLYATALALEKDSVIFYTELIDLIGSGYPAEADLLKKIRGEEQKHIHALVKAHSRLS
jgi:rubrerythrin